MAILSLRSTATARLPMNMSILTTSIITFLSFYCNYCDALAGSSGSGSSGSSFRFKLTPDTSPIEIIEQQLVALQNDNIDDVYKYASPINKAGIGNNIQIFNQIVRSYPYSSLIRHKRSIILLESKLADSKQYLVRIVASSSSSSTSSALSSLSSNGSGSTSIFDDDDGDDDDEESNDPNEGGERTNRIKIFEYWWSLSRTKTGDYPGSYMVDAVIPNQI